MGTQELRVNNLLTTGFLVIFFSRSPPDFFQNVGELEGVVGIFEIGTPENPQKQVFHPKGGGGGWPLGGG